jgi:hypothetical protein
MKNILRRVTVALLLLAPAVALAGDGSESCCHSSCCPDCGHCPNRPNQPNQ